MKKSDASVGNGKAWMQADAKQQLRGFGGVPCKVTQQDVKDAAAAPPSRQTLTQKMFENQIHQIQQEQDEKIKALITGDGVESRSVPAEEQKAFAPGYEHIFSCSKLPGEKDESAGFWRDLVVAPWGVPAAEVNDARYDAERYNTIYYSQAPAQRMPDRYTRTPALDAGGFGGRKHIQEYVPMPYQHLLAQRMASIRGKPVFLHVDGFSGEELGDAMSCVPEGYTYGVEGPTSLEAARRAEAAGNSVCKEMPMNGPFHDFLYGHSPGIVTPEDLRTTVGGKTLGPFETYCEHEDDLL